MNFEIDPNEQAQQTLPATAADTSSLHRFGRADNLLMHLRQMVAAGLGRRVGVPTLRLSRSHLVLRLGCLCAGLAGLLSVSAAEDVPPADVIPFAGLTASEAVAKATLPPGFKMHAFAAEPDVQQPIAFCIDDRGRLWVAEGFTYPRRKGHPPRDERPVGADRSQPSPEQLKDIMAGKDRILVFEDTDGDHKFDRRTVFIENLNLVSGLEVGFGGVWIGAAPYLMFIPIADGDAPKPAGAPKLLLDGWGWGDTHETLNTFCWGPDGWLYGCQGVFTYSNVGRPGAPDPERQWVDACVWRYHPVRHTFEVFSEGGSNPWGVDFDANGQCWIEMCVIPHLFHMIQGGHIERQDGIGGHFTVGREETDRLARYRRADRKPLNPFIFEDISTHGDHVHWAGNRGPHAANARSDSAGGGHAHAGLTVYLGTSWPAQYRGNLFIGNIHGQRLNVDIPEPRGSGYVGRHGADFLNFNDTWSQTLNHIVDQDGSMFIIDWYDKNQCHHGVEEGHDRSNGRIYKVVYHDQKVAQPILPGASDDALVKLVGSENEFLSRHARRMLQERAANGPLGRDVHAQLRELFVRGPATWQRLRALWALHQTGGLDARTVLAAVQHPDEWVRAWVIQLVSESQENIERVIREIQEQGLESDTDLNSLAENDPSPAVRRFIASAVPRLPGEELRAGLVQRLLRRSEDAQDHNLPLMIWYAMEPLVAGHPQESLEAAMGTHLPKILNFTTRRVMALGSTEARGFVVETLARAEDEGRQLEILRGMRKALEGQRNVPMPVGWDTLEPKLTVHAQPEIRSLSLQLALTFGSQRALESLRQLVADPAADIGARRAALDSLISIRDAGLPDRLRGLLGEVPLRSQALRALAGFEDAATPAAILAVYPNLGGEKRDALNTLSSRASFATALLAAVGEGQVPSRDLSAELIRQLRNLKNAEVDALIQQIWGAVRESDADKKALIEKFKRTYWSGGSQPGNAFHGRAVYTRICQQCHTLYDVGGKVGPDITGSNRGDLDYLLQTILDPNAVIPNDYRASTLEMKDDRVITGIIKEQNDRTITIVNATESLVLPRDEISAITPSEISMMPEGLLEPLPDQEMRDLIYYLTRPGQVPLLATPDTAILLFNGKDFAGWEANPDLWRIENGEIVGSSKGLAKSDYLKSQMIATDFKFTCQVKLSPDTGNSGIQFRSQTSRDAEGIKGPQADIGQGWWGKLYDVGGRGAVSEKSGDAFAKPGDWNVYEIVATGSHVKISLNGNVCVDVDDPQLPRQGFLAFQLHQGEPMEIRIKDLHLEVNLKPVASR